jgi:hypothetical protein
MEVVDGEKARAEAVGVEGGKPRSRRMKGGRRWALVE